MNAGTLSLHQYQLLTKILSNPYDIEESNLEKIMDRYVSISEAATIKEVSTDTLRMRKKKVFLYQKELKVGTEGINCLN